MSDKQTCRVCGLNAHRTANPHGRLFAEYLQDLWYKYEYLRIIRSEAEDHGALLAGHKEPSCREPRRRQLRYPYCSSLTWAAQISWCKFEASVSDPKDVIPMGDGAPEQPPLTIMSLAVRTVVNHRENKREVVCVSGRIWRDGKHQCATRLQTIDFSLQYSWTTRHRQSSCRVQCTHSYVLWIDSLPTSRCVPRPTGGA